MPDRMTCSRTCTCPQPRLRTQPNFASASVKKVHQLVQCRWELQIICFGERLWAAYVHASDLCLAEGALRWGCAAVTVGQVIHWHCRSAITLMGGREGHRWWLRGKSALGKKEGMVGSVLQHHRCIFYGPGGIRQV